MLPHLLPWQAANAKRHWLLPKVMYLKHPISTCAPGCGREVMQEAWETIKAMREEFQEQNNIYWAAEQEFRSWRNVDRERK